jgi:hypothetical protein
MAPSSRVAFLGAAFLQACAVVSQIPDRLSLARIPTGATGAAGAASVGGAEHDPEPLAFVDVFTRGLEGVPDFRWPHIVHVPSRAHGGGASAPASDTLLALASGCNATVVCSSAHAWPCCMDTDEQMLMLRRSEDGGRTWSNLSYPYLQPQGGGRWPFPPNLKAAGQMLWDAAGGRVYLFFAVEQAHNAPNVGCVGDGQTMLGLMLSHSSDLGLSWSKPQNLSAAMAPQWPSLCLAPSGGNSMLILGGKAAHEDSMRRLLLMADVVGTIPGKPHAHGELMIHLELPPPGSRRHSTGPEPPLPQVNITQSLLRPCADPVTGKPCDFDEAAMALLPATHSSPETVFVVLRSDPAVTHSYATTTSTDGGVTFGPIEFQSGLTSVACQPSAVALGGSLYVAAPQLGHRGPLPNPSARSNMTVAVSRDGQGAEWSVLRSVFAGPSMYSNLAVDSAREELLLFFERAGE